MRDTLVLNASFEPLSTVTLNRAVVLVLQDKAVVEQAHPGLRMRGPRSTSGAAGDQALPVCTGAVPKTGAVVAGGVCWYGTSTGARTAGGGRRPWTTWCRGRRAVRTPG